MNNFFKDYTSMIDSGDTLRFQALGSQGRIHIEGSGNISMQVSVDGVHYAPVEHSVAFDGGIAIAPFQFFIGDYVRLSATSLSKVIINYNKI